MRISQRFASALFGALALCPLAAWGQAGGDAGRNVGVVTTLAGQATVARAALASPVPLRFKDDVFLRDRIATAERSVVRVLLGDLISEGLVGVLSTQKRPATDQRLLRMVLDGLESL